MLFQKLRDWIDDEPDGLNDLAFTDESVRTLCNEVYWSSTLLSMNERRRRNIFAAPVDPKFIATWRDYEDRYAQVLASIWLSDIFPILENGEVSRRPYADVQWENADYEGEEQAGAIQAAVDFAYNQATQEWRDFTEGFPESIEEGISAWDRLKAEAGFDLRGIFRRRELIPFVLVPRHVAMRHGSAEKLSLFTHLQQAHDAFVFGVPFAAVALMRSILELVLRDHYGAEGKDLEDFCSISYRTS